MYDLDSAARAGFFRSSRNRSLGAPSVAAGSSFQLGKNPMRVLFSSTKGLGHLRPLLPYALGARARGHSVCVATPERADETLKSLGLERTPFATPADDDVTAVTASWRGLPAQEFTVRFVTEVFGN